MTFLFFFSLISLRSPIYDPLLKRKKVVGSFHRSKKELIPSSNLNEYINQLSPQMQDRSRIWTGALQSSFSRVDTFKIDHTFLKEKSLILNSTTSLPQMKHYMHITTIYFHTKCSAEPRKLAQNLRARTRHETSTESNHLNFFSIRNLRRNFSLTSFATSLNRREDTTLISIIRKPSNQGSIFIYPINLQLRIHTFVHITRLIHHNRFNSN